MADEIRKRCNFNVSNSESQKINNGDLNYLPTREVSSKGANFFKNAQPPVHCLCCFPLLLIARSLYFELADLCFFVLKQSFLITWFARISRSFRWDKLVVIRVLGCQIIYNLPKCCVFASYSLVIN